MKGIVILTVGPYDMQPVYRGHRARAVYHHLLLLLLLRKGRLHGSDDEQHGGSEGREIFCFDARPKYGLVKSVQIFKVAFLE